MNVFQAISTLKTAKSFEDRPVDEKMIGLILHMGTHAVSAGNQQEWEFVVIEDPKTKEKLAKIVDSKKIKEAPSVIVVCANTEKMKLKYGDRGENFYAIQDTGEVVMLILVAANALGLGSDVIKSFDEIDVKGFVGLPDELKPVALVPVGYAKEWNEEGKVTPFGDLTHVNRYGNKIDIDFKPVEAMLNEAVEKLKAFREVKKKEANSIFDFLKRRIR